MRAEIIKVDPDDIREKVIKLILNSRYGKMAEAVGARNDGKPPPTANPFYAARITGWTRAQALRAALHDPDSIVMFCTDGIIATKPLHGEGRLPTASEKTLGMWEFKPGADISEAGVFDKAGIYSFFELKEGKVKENTKTRGFKFDFPRKCLLNDVRGRGGASKPRSQRNTSLSGLP